VERGVFCRGCGEEIHETATACLHCSAPQVTPSEVDSTRSAGTLIGWAIVWTLVFWIGSLILVGIIVAAIYPAQDALTVAGQAGEALCGLFLLISLSLSAGLTIKGKLPGTEKPKLPRPNSMPNVSFNTAGVIKPCQPVNADVRHPVMSQSRMKRLGIGGGAFIFSVGISAFARALLTAAVASEANRRPGFGAGIGIFFLLVIWPGLLTFCLVLFDGLYMHGFSKRLLLRSALWGSVMPIACYFGMKAGLRIIALPGTTIGTLLSLIFPAVLLAYLGIRGNRSYMDKGSV
jgi:hypothetical protein